MATPPRRPGRPGGARPARAARAPAAPVEQFVDDQGNPVDADGNPIEGEAAPAKPPVNITVMVTLGAILVTAILILWLALGSRDFLMEVENLSDEPLDDVKVRVNNETYTIGHMRENSVDGARVRRTAGNDVEVEYTIPSRGGKLVKRLPKTGFNSEKDREEKKDSKVLDVDFATYTGTCRIRLEPK